MDQVVNLWPIGNRNGNRPVNNSEFINGPSTNRPQVNNLPHKKLLLSEQDWQ